MDDRHKGTIIAMLYNELKDRDYLFRQPFSGPPDPSKVRGDLEEIAESILRFFSEPDSFKKNWTLQKFEGVSVKVEWMPSAVFKSVADKTEGNATKAADLLPFESANLG